MISVTPQLSSILAERRAQDEKWGRLQDGENRHTLLEWSAILGEEFGEVAHDILALHFGGETEDRRKRLREEVTQVAAVALAMLESIDNGWLTEDA